MGKARWNTEELLKGKTLDENINLLKEEVNKFCRHKEKLEKATPAQLLEIIKEKEQLNVLRSRIGAYLELTFSENTQNQEILGKLTSYGQLATELSNKLLFFSHWLITMPKEKANKYLEATELADYHYYLTKLQEEKEHTKSQEIEEVMNIMSTTSEAAADLYEVFTNGFAYAYDGKEGLSQAEVAVHVRNQEPQKREEAYKTLLTKYAEHSTLLAEMYKNIILDWYNEGVQIRGYKNPLNIRNTGNDVPDEAVEALMKVVRRNANVFADYFKIKYELNKRQGAQYPFNRYHLYAPYPSKNTKTYDYEKTKELVLETYKAFDERLYKAAKKMIEDNHVHSHPQKNKRGGAFNYSIDTQTTPYTLLNHTNELRDVMTMMHEFGHGIHGVLSQEQNETNYHYTLPMAETASIFGETLLTQRMLTQSEDEEEKKELLINQLDDQYATIIRQTYFVIFEKEAHEMIRNGATKKELEEAYTKGLKEQFGEMQIPEEFKHEWHYIPHIHASPFYCYAYAWGNLMVLALYEKYRKEGEAFKDKYVELLSAGGSESAATLLKRIMDIDVSSVAFWEEGFNVIKREIETLKKLTE